MNIGLGLGFKARSNTALQLPYANVANHTNIPEGLLAGTSSTNYVDHCCVQHKAGPVNYTEIQPVFYNATYTNDVEGQGAVSFYLRAGLYYNGTWYPMYFGGSRDVFVDKAYGVVKADIIAGLTIPAGARFWISTRRISELGASSGSFQWNYTVKTSGIDGGFKLQGTDPAVDYTLGLNLPFGAEFGYSGVNGSNGLTTIPIVSGGANYTATPSIQWWHGWAGRGNAGATVPGTGASGYASRTSGVFTSGTISAAGTGYSSTTPPKAYLGGGTFAETGAYSASFIMGRPSSKTPSVMILGDSYSAGGTVSPDMVMTNYQYVVQNYSYHSIANSGAQNIGVIQNGTHRLAYLDQLIAWGYAPTHCMNGMGVNDFANNTNTDADVAILGQINTVNNMMRSRGMKIICVTIPARTTSTDGWTTLTNQTAYNSNYVSGGRVQNYNSLLRNQTGISYDHLIDGAAYWRDTTADEKWKINLYGTGICTSDGVHPGGTGKQWAADNLPLLTLNV